MKRYRNSPLTEKRYHYIKQYLAFKGNRYASDMTGYSMSTVNLVRRTKDFEEYQSYNRSRRGKTNSTASTGWWNPSFTVNIPNKEEDTALMLSTIKAQGELIDRINEAIDHLDVRMDRLRFRVNVAYWTAVGLIALVIILISQK